MSNRREKAKAQNAQLNRQLEQTAKPILKEKLIYEGGKFCLDLAKLIFGAVILASIMQQEINVWLLISLGFGVIITLIVFGFTLINKLK